MTEVTSLWTDSHMSAWIKEEKEVKWKEATVFFSHINMVFISLLSHVGQGGALNSYLVSCPKVAFGELLKCDPGSNGVECVCVCVFRPASLCPRRHYLHLKPSIHPSLYPPYSFVSYLSSRQRILLKWILCVCLLYMECLICVCVHIYEGALCFYAAVCMFGF